MTSTELAALFQALSTILAPNHPLLDKISPTPNSNTNQTLQFSSEEAELILDNLPIPTAIQDRELLQARKKIQDFIFEFNQNT